MLEDYITVQQILDAYGVQKSYVYKLACIHKWRRAYGERGNRSAPYVMYAGEDVRAILGAPRFVAGEGSVGEGGGVVRIA